MGYRGRERGGQRSEEWDKQEGSGIESTQRNDIERKGTGWTALRRRERGGQCSEEWDTEEGNRVDSIQMNGIQRKGME